MSRMTVTLLPLLCCAAVAAAAETAAPLAVTPRLQSVASLQDAASDVAIWVHPADPQRSLVLGAGGTAGLEIFGLDGAALQQVPSPQAEFVDVRYGVPIGSRTVDLVLAVDVSRAQLHFFTVDQASRRLEPLPGKPVDLGVEATGFCSYRSPVTGKIYALVATDDGDLEQLELHDRDGGIAAISIRRVPLGRGAGPCAVDDATETVVVSVETTGLWRLSVEPESDATPVQIDALAPFGTIEEEVKGVAIYRADAATAYVFAADIGQGVLRIYDLEGKPRGAIALASHGAIPAVGEAEGLALVSGSLPGFDGGLLAVTDEEARAYYEAHRTEFTTPSEVMLREILIEVPATSRGINAAQDDEAKAKAEEIRQRLIKGEPFPRLAAEVSASPSKANGGFAFLLAHVANPEPAGIFPRYADAVAVAGVNAFATAYASGEPREGAEAFLAKRAPRFERP